MIRFTGKRTCYFCNGEELPTFNFDGRELCKFCASLPSGGTIAHVPELRANLQMIAYAVRVLQKSIKAAAPKRKPKCKPSPVKPWKKPAGKYPRGRAK